MFGTSHSWAVTMRSLAENFIRLNNKVYIESTNGDSLVDDSLKKFFRKTTSPDIDICYTLPRNFQHRFLKSSNTFSFQSSKFFFKFLSDAPTV